MTLKDLVDLIWGSLSTLEKGMVLFTLVAYVLFAVYSPAKTVKSVRLGAVSLVRIFLLLLSGVFLGSLVGIFLPRDVIARVLGKESGFIGIVLGTAFGAVIPGGPYVLFPVLAALYSSGAGIPPMVAMIFAWSCIALTRIPLELGYLSVVNGQKLVWLRVLIGVPLPFIAGLLAGVVASAILR